MSGFQKWKDGADRADIRWDSHDATIKDVVTRYNMHLTRTPGYWSLDWRMVKAMVWTETGPHNSDWTARPMRMGVPGDAGLPALRSGREGSDLIVPPGMIIGSRATIDPRENIRAGVGYLLMRMANFDMITVTSDDKSIFEVTVGPTEKSWEAVAKRCSTTNDVLLKLNPGHQYIHAGQVLKCQKASIQKVITGWKNFDVATIARLYNGDGRPSGDPYYSRKLAYAMKRIAR